MWGAPGCYWAAPLGSTDPNRGFVIPKIANASRSLRTTCKFGRASAPSNSNIRAKLNIAGEPATMQRGISGLGIAGGDLANSRIVREDTAMKVTPEGSEMDEKVGFNRPYFDMIA